MKKRLLLMLVVSALTSVNLFAEEKPAEEKKISYNVALDFGSTYIWRAYDNYAPHLNTTGGNPKTIFDFAPGIFPSVTVSVYNGLSFNIWGARSLIARTATQGELKNYDEIDFTGTYTIADKSGTFASSIIGYVFPTASNAGAIPSYAELAFNYTAPILLKPSAFIAASMGPKGSEYEYASISISHDIEAGILTIAPKLLVGYWYLNNATAANPNKMHIDLYVPFNFKISESFEFHVAAMGCYRVFGFDSQYSPFLLVGSLGASYSF